MVSMRWFIFLAFSSVYILSLGSRLSSSDAQVMYETSRALAFQQTIRLEADFGMPQIRQGEDGYWYSQYDPGLPLLAAPLVWLSDTVAQGQLWNRYAFAAYMVLWISALGAALSLVVLYDIAGWLYGDKRPAILVPVIAGLCTPLWTYGTQFFAEGLLAGLVTLGFWGVYRGKWWAGLVIGMAILIRAAMVIYLIPLLWLLVKVENLTVFFDPIPDPSPSRGRRTTLPQFESIPVSKRRGVGGRRTTLPQFKSIPVSKRRGVGGRRTTLPQFKSIPSLLRGGLGWGQVKPTILFLAFASLGIIGLGYHNWLRSGNPLTFGYESQAFDTPPWEGIAGMLFSPGKSIFLYAPPLILSLVFFPRFWRRERRLAEAMLLATGIALLFYGSWWAWHGGWCWGPRFLVPLIPLWVLPVGEGLVKTEQLTQANKVDVVEAGRGAYIDAPWKICLLAGRIGTSAPTSFGLCVVLGSLITLLGTFTDVNQHYARWGMVNYSIAGLPILGAVRSLSAGHTERLATFHLQEMGWLPLAASLFPAALVLIVLVASIKMARQMSVKEGI
jgi:hypothetical protein